jgi:hypothetical protein
MTYFKSGLFLLLSLLICSSSYASPVWYLTPGNNPGADIDGDLGFQASVAGLTFIEEDFDGYPDYGYPGPTLTYGAVDVTLSMSNGNVPRTWQGSWDGGAGTPGGIYGTIYGRALPSYGAHNYTFSFSGTDIVKGFGIWIFDDNTGYADNFTMTVESVGGDSWTSAILDANPEETAHAIDGFLGVYLADGIHAVTINNAQSGVFHLDHMQIASVPEPATFILLGSGLAGLAFYRRKRK